MTVAMLGLKSWKTKPDPDAQHPSDWCAAPRLGIRSWKRLHEDAPVPSVPQLCGPSRVTQQGGKLSLRKRILKQVQGRSTPGSFTSRWLRCRVDVCLGTLKLIQAGDEELSTSYQENGVDKFRIKNVTSGRRCKCSWNCTQQVPTDELQEICNLWQRLSDEQQSQYLSVQRYGASEFKPAVKADWFLNGHHVCFRGLARLLGTSEPTLLRRVRMSLDLRKSWVGGPRQMVERRTARNYVDLFFMELYHACAEDLPENLHAGDLDPTFAGEEAPPDDISKVFNWTPEAALAERIPHLLGPEPDAPTRHLPPGKPVLLFWQMKAWWAAIQEITSKTKFASRLPSDAPPSWSTFYRAWSEKWVNIQQAAPAPPPLHRNAQCVGQETHATGASYVLACGS